MKSISYSIAFFSLVLLIVLMGETGSKIVLEKFRNLDFLKEETLVEVQEDKKKVIHVVAHSHQDAGWGRTAIQYFNGAVSGIYTNVTRYLQENPDKKFSHAEIWFFQRWWYNQSSETQEVFKQLVKEKRFEFVNGGWVASDEACPIYEDLVENIVQGHKFLKETFDIVPKIGWHCDSFGHSSVMNYVFQMMGYESLFFGRMTDAERVQRIANKTMDFIWQPTFETAGGPQTLGSGLYSHLMYDTYTVPCQIPMTNYWNTDDAEQIRHEFMTLLATNATRADELIQCLNVMADSYEFDNILFTHGYDFAFYDADNTYGLLDDIIEFVYNRTDRFTFVHSTVGEYVDVVKQEIQDKSVSLAVHHDDFFPMEEIYKDSFWTGYFTSRSNSKKAMREFSTLTYLSNTLYAFDQFKSGFDITTEKMGGDALSGELGLLQHHDTITGTSYQYVNDDYMYQVDNNTVNNSRILNEQIQSLAMIQGVNLSDITYCAHEVNKRFLCPHDVSESLKEGIVISVFNPYIQDQKLVNLQFKTPNLKIKQWNVENQGFESVNAEAICYYNPDFRLKQECDVYVNVTIPALSVVLLKIKEIETVDISLSPSECGTITNGLVKLDLDQESEDGLLEFLYSQQQVQKKFSFEFRYYKTYKAPQNTSQTESGLYIFKSEYDNSFSYNHTVAEIFTYQGDIVSMFVVEYRSEENPTHSTFLKVKLFKESTLPDQIEFDIYMEGIETLIGVDATVNWKCEDLDNDGVFYTDTNALEMMKRYTDSYASKYQGTTTQRASSNYYPVNAAVMIEDALKGEQMIVMNDRSEGGSAYNNGTIELMINRRGNTSDSLGNEEPLDEFIVVDGKTVGIRVNAKYHLQFTNTRSQAFDNIKRRYLLNQHATQIFTSIHHLNSYSTIFQDVSDKRLALIDALSAFGIDEFQLKLFEPQTVLMTLTTDTIKELISADEIAQKICDYANAQVNRGCTSDFEVLEAWLDGQLPSQSADYDQQVNFGKMKAYQIVVKDANIGTPYMVIDI